MVYENGQTIDKLGKAGETVSVAPGYFRNHLMPKLLAVPNIDKYAFLIREQRKVVVVLLLIIFIESLSLFFFIARVLYFFFLGQFFVCLVVSGGSLLWGLINSLNSVLAENSNLIFFLLFFIYLLFLYWAAIPKRGRGR